MLNKCLCCKRELDVKCFGTRQRKKSKDEMKCLDCTRQCIKKFRALSVPWKSFSWMRYRCLVSIDIHKNVIQNFKSKIFWLYENLSIYPDEIRDIIWKYYYSGNIPYKN